MKAGSSNDSRCGRASAFTLIELILVMTILAIAVSITAPALANFFRGRILDSEARRLLGLTRQGQSRAVSEGVPMELWIDSAQNAYGLEAEPSYEPTDAKAVNITMDSDLQVQVVSLNTASLAATTRLANSMSTMSSGSAPVMSNHPSLPRIRFLPDGSIGDVSPEMVQLVHRDGKSLWLALSRNRMNYEIQNRNSQ
jgi:prepilin-type N-terminal cleavage/methylation domain-containing protein